MQAIWWWLFVAMVLIAAVEIGIHLGRVTATGDSSGTRDTLRQATGIIATLTALVLGLLIANGQKSFEQQAGAIASIVVDIAHLDEVPAEYGEDAAPPRAALRQSIGPILSSLWLGEKEADLDRDSRLRNEVFLSGILALPDDTPQRKLLKETAYAIAGKLIQERFQLAILERSMVPGFLLAALVGWSFIVFLGLGACANGSAISRAALYLGAASTATAVFLVIEFDTPFSGIIQISHGAVDLLAAALGGS